MPTSIHDALITITHGLEIAGAGALVLGFVITTISWFVRWRTLGAKEAREHYRRALGRVVLVGLEVLVAATILKTVTITAAPPQVAPETAPPPAIEPVLQSLGLLALMVAIRTILGWAMVLEMYGRWPWQRKPAVEP